ncbi:hypothetical protein BCON_0659g00010 [Botryotinia convoluta]|uniref:Uncharacterized protein n=1 Tax=Botryotinia convoluta TaxID=54673 RepID=A0A4Z1H7G5_9HELO|nr:hypothetical protein BCON_0659g00010 [Botryotinia convoluta]
MSGGEFTGKDIEDISSSTTLHFAALLSLDKVCLWLVENSELWVNVNKFSSIGTPLACTLAPNRMLRRDHSPYLDQSRVSNNRYKILEWSPLAMAVNANIGWDILLKEETQGLTALNSASMNGHIDVVRLLIDHGTALELKDSRSNHFRGFRHLTDFMLALLNGHIEVAMLLENGGADINALDNHGHSALHMAASYSVSMVEYILHSPSFHQTVSVRSTANITVLMIAAIRGDVDNRHQSSGKLSNAALLNIVDNDNQTALHVLFDMLDVKSYSPFIERFALELLTLATKEDVNSVLPDGRSFLNISFDNGYDTLSQKLVNMDIDVGTRGKIDGTNYSPLELLCIHSSGNQELIRSMVYGQRPEGLYECRDDILIHLACCYHGSIAVIEELLSAGWSTETTDKLGYTPIISAISGGEESTVELLLTHGAHLENVMYRFGKPDQPYHPIEHAKTEVIYKLIDSIGIDNWNPEAFDDREETFLGGWIPGITSDATDSESYPGTWTTKPISNVSILHVAAFHGNLAVLEFGLVQKRLEVNIRASFGLTPLFFAIFGCNESVVKSLLKLGADVNEYYGPIKVTPLHVALAGKNVSIIEIFMAHGASANSADVYGWTPIKVASLEYKHDKMVQVLENSSSPAAPLLAIIEESEETVKIDDRIHIALEEALLRNNIDNVEALFQTGCSPKGICSCGCTLLVTVLHEGSLELAHYLIDRGIVNELLIYGADLEARDQYGNTALHCALLSRSLKVAMMLISAGANANSLSGENQSPIQMAVAHCAPSIVLVLHKFGASLETDIPEMVHALTKSGMDLNTADDTGVPVLLTALNYPEEDFILELLPESDVIRHPTLGTTLNQASFQSLLKIVSTYVFIFIID